MKEKCVTALPWILYFYVVALTCSVAGMEIGAALLTLLVLTLAFIAFFDRKSTTTNFLKDLKFDGSWALWGFILMVWAGAIFIEGLSGNDQKEIIRASRFVFTLYALLIGLQILVTKGISGKQTSSFKTTEETQKAIVKLIKALVVAAGIVAVYGVIQFFTGADILRKAPYTMTIFDNPNIPLYRVKAFYTNTMSYSYIFGMLSALFLSFWYFGAIQFKKRWLMPLVAAVVTLTVFMTFTRGVWIALIVALIVMAFLISRQLAAKVILIGALLFAGLFVSSEPFRQRFSGIIHLDQSNSERLMIWRVHYEMFKDHPFLGVGFEQNNRLMPDYNQKIWGHSWRVIHAHNHFLQILTGTGIFGFIFFLIFSGYFLKAALALYRFGLDAQVHNGVVGSFYKAMGLGSFGAQIVFHLGGLSEAVFVDRESNHAYLLVVALTLVVLAKAQSYGKLQKQ